MRVVNWILFVVLLVAGTGFLVDTAMNSYFETEWLTCTAMPAADDPGRVTQSCPQAEGPVGALLGIGLYVLAAAIGRPWQVGSKPQQAQPSYPPQQPRPAQPGYQAPPAGYPAQPQQPQQGWPAAQTQTPSHGLPAQQPQQQPQHPQQQPQQGVPYAGYPGYGYGQQQLQQPQQQQQQPPAGQQPPAQHPHTGPNPVVDQGPPPQEGQGQS